MIYSNHGQDVHHSLNHFLISKSPLLAVIMFHLDFATEVRCAILKVMADTGCQSCIAGLKAIKRLGIQKENLIPVTVKMSAANETSLQILGAAILRFTGMGPDGKCCQTGQIVYITDSTDKIYLSREGCVALGLISKDFPTMAK